MKKPKVLILHAPGTNRDGDLAAAISKAGGEAITLPLSLLRANKAPDASYGMLALPGGFSYGDALGAGRLFALDLQTWFSDFMQSFIESGRPVIGICNGFQALVKGGYLPGGSRQATLAANESGRFECRWVTLRANPTNSSPWLEGLDPILCPVAHGEGRFLCGENQELPPDQVAFCYAHSDGRLAEGAYPANPNGSIHDIAGITNRAGNVLGLMPHPEDHIHPFQHPHWARGSSGSMGLKLIENGLKMI